MMAGAVVTVVIHAALLFIPDKLWPLAMAVTGIASAVYILGWSYPYSETVPVNAKLKVMSALIIGANIVYIINNLLSQVLPLSLLLFISVFPLVLVLPFLVRFFPEEDKDDLTVPYFHDQLTGLYNKYYFEEEMQRLDTKRQLPVSIVMVDLNGLKLAIASAVKDEELGEDIDKDLESVIITKNNKIRSRDIMSFSQELRREADEIWASWHQHPFIKGIGSGNLKREKFVYWIKQDYLYLIDYSRVFAYAAARARKLEHMQHFARLMDGVLNTEMNLHRNYCAEFGIKAEELEELEKSPTCQAYTDFLVRTAATESLGVTVGALLPCFWGFFEIGNRLKEVGDTSEKNPYRHWIEMYSSGEFEDLARWSRELTDELGEEAGPSEKEAIKEAFVTSSRYETRFWDMAQELEEW